MNDHLTQKREIIINAAIGVFSSYGFQRTSMEDIAKRAGISRPALYLVFSNKKDIFRAIVESVLDDCLLSIRKSLDTDASLEIRLNKAFDESIVAWQRQVKDMPHGDQVMGLKNELAADILDDWAGKLREIFNEVFAKETDDAKFAADFAVLAENAVAGIKARDLDPDLMSKEFASVAHSIAAAFSR